MHQVRIVPPARGGADALCGGWHRWCSGEQPELLWACVLVTGLSCCGHAWPITSSALTLSHMQPMAQPNKGLHANLW
jgi:hypothetical protein